MQHGACEKMSCAEVLFCRDSRTCLIIMLKSSSCMREHKSQHDVTRMID